MEKTIFNNTTYYWTVITIFIFLLANNLYVAIVGFNLMVLLPLLILSTLLFLTMTKNKFAKNGIKIWAMIFLIIASGLQFFGQFLKDIADGFENIDFGYYIKTGLSVCLGVVIYIYANKTIDIVNIDIDVEEAGH
ncbi:hypothetical protein QO200_08380 [Flavobacterium sp. Arc3]|jgi:cation transport ATPase|uniref:hypothetical protein n=1 Tax=unclassified Flavobacterium TaxID=196869 RepID=UPI00352CDFA7